MRLDLAPIFQDDRGLRSYLQTNFRRIELLLGITPKIVSGVASVTGTLTVATGLTLINNCFACFASDPDTDGFILAVNTSGTSDIAIRVFNATWPTGAGTGFQLSTVAKNIRWFALGD